MKAYLLTAAIAALAAAPALAQDGATVTVAESEAHGSHLADADGRALYLFTTDKPDGAEQARVTCTSEACLGAWPLYTTQGEPQAGEGVDAAMLGTLDYEGEQVVTYNGWPLYHFARDQGADAPQGQDIESFGGEWYLVQPSGEKVGD